MSTWHERAVIDRTGEIGRVAAARGQHEKERGDAARSVEADLVVGDEIVALARHQHVEIAIGAQLDRTPGPRRQHRRGAGEERRLALLAAEAAPHAPALHDHVVRAQVEGVRDEVLHLARVLRRADSTSIAPFSCGSAAAICPSR